MKNLTLKNITVACNGTLYGDANENEVTGVVIDSRLLAPGNLFIATRGEKTDGHTYITDVVKAGATAVVCERPPTEPIPIPYIIVRDSFQALKDIATFYRNQLDIKVIGITGSAGKTSAKEFIAAVLAERFLVLKTAGNYNNEIGLPLTVLGIRADHKVAVLEMGINNFGEMSRLSSIAKPDIAVITNIGDCHLENLGDRAGVLRAKSEIFDYLALDGFAVINAHDEWLSTLDNIKGKKPLRFGLDIIADEISALGLDGASARFTICHESLGIPGTSFPINIPIPGEHMITNALIATTVASLVGLDTTEIQNGLTKVETVAGRSHIIRLPHLTIIDDCYNANPLSMRAALVLLSSAKGRKVAVLGDMFELGECEIDFHAEVGRDAIETKVDCLVCIGKLAKHIFDAAVEYECLTEAERAFEKHFYPDKKSFLLDMDAILKSGDTVLVKASHGMHFEELVGRLVSHERNT